MDRYDEAIAHHQAVVDNWPDYHLAWSSQYWIGSFQQELKKQGLLTTAEADARSEQAFLRLFEEYPNTPMVKTARSQLAMIYLRRVRGLPVQLQCRRIALRHGMLNLPESQ